MNNLKISGKLEASKAASDLEENDNPETGFASFLAGVCVLPPPAANAAKITDSDLQTGDSDSTKISQSPLAQTAIPPQTGKEIPPDNELANSLNEVKEINPEIAGLHFGLSETLDLESGQNYLSLSKVVKPNIFEDKGNSGALPKSDILPEKNWAVVNNDPPAANKHSLFAADEIYVRYPWESSPPSKPGFQTATTADTVTLPNESGGNLGRVPKLFREINEILQVENQTGAPPAAANQTEAAQSLKSDAVSQIEPQILRLAALVEKKGDKQMLRMRLHPAELGTVEIKLERNSSGGLDAHLQTENEAAKQVLAGGLEQLRQSLEAAGWQIGRLEISQNSFSFSENQQRDAPADQAETDGNNFRENSINRTGEGSDKTRQNPANRLVSLRA